MRVLGRSNLRYAARSSSCVFAVFIGVVFVLSNLIGFIHEATTPHVRCAEHGELIHGEPGTGTATTSTTSHATVEPGTGGHSLGHDHCQLSCSSHESRCAPRPPVVQGAPAVGCELTAPSQLVAHARSTTLYRTAPKTSPPA